LSLEISISDSFFNLYAYLRLIDRRSH